VINPSRVKLYREKPLYIVILFTAFFSSGLFTLCGKPNPLTPFPTREGGKFKASLLAGERFGEGFYT
jgi:hypothetical protein